MLRKLLGFGNHQPDQATKEVGFYLNDANKNTFLYNSLKNNNMQSVVDYFHHIKENNKTKQTIENEVGKFDLFNLTQSSTYFSL